MRYLFYLLLMSSLLYSCKGNKKASAQDSTVKSSIATNQTEELIKKFKPIIHGVWVKKDYIEKIKQTKSPLAAMDLADDIITMYFNTDSIKGDSLNVIHGNTHEGSQFMLKFHQGSTSNALSFNGSELSYSIQKGDTILAFARRGFDGKKMITTRYIRALPKLIDNDLATGINYFINKAVMTGTYSLTDSLGTISKVTFTNGGKVSGFNDFTGYTINFDLNSDPWITWTRSIYLNQILKKINGIPINSSRIR